MSLQRSYNIQCPKCRHSWGVELHESVNVKSDPPLRDELFGNRINAVTCPACEFAFRVDKPLLYSDPDRRLLIYWIPLPPDRRAEGEERFAEWLREAGMVMPDGVQAPEVHLVFSRIELIERIFLREAGLDERVVEYVKYLMYTRNSGKLDATAQTLLFNAQDSTPEALCFVVLDDASRQFRSVLHYLRSAYQAVADTFGSADKAADLLEMFPGPYVSAKALLLEEQREQALDSEEESAEPASEPEPPESEEDPDQTPGS